MKNIYVKCKDDQDINDTMSEFIMLIKNDPEFKSIGWFSPCVYVGVHKIKFVHAFKKDWDKFQAKHKKDLVTSSKIFINCFRDFYCGFERR